MCDRLVHRGPDGSGYFRDGCIGLGHRRLAIIDLSTGDQPMGNEDGSLQVVFNGEIYNYRELREELVKKGHRFRTKSDTEVLVHLYEEEGERMPERLNGMFAFAIWDAGRQELYLARDRFGKKPLYYTTAVPGMRLAFGSELKALAAIPGFPSKIHARSVSDFLCFGYVPDPLTIYEDVFKLPPAHSLLVTAGQSRDRKGAGEEGAPRLRRYWRPVFDIREDANFEEEVEKIRALAADSVKRRMISDVPLGAFLSGGVDSSAVVALMARPDGPPVRTFSIGFTNESFDERRFARMIVERYRTGHQEQVVSPDIFEMLEVLVKHYDEPFGDSSAIPMLYLSRMTRQYVTVALCGDGADELFGGYRRYLYGVREQRLREMFPDWFRKSVVKAGARYYPRWDRAPRALRARSTLVSLSEELADMYFGEMSAFRERGFERVFAPSLGRLLGGYSTREHFTGLFRAVRDLAPLQQMQAVDFDTYLPGDILVKADRATMAYSLESRSPWLDYRLGELACRLPAAFKLKDGVGKRIFKRAMEPYLPEEILRRRKMGFGVPLVEWFRTALRPVFPALVLRPEMEEYLDLDEVRRYWEEHQQGRRNHAEKLWYLFMLGCWDARHRSGTWEKLRPA
jgi:asparagine synthase (glutamine-hydrolysing)